MWDSVYLYVFVWSTIVHCDDVNRQQVQERKMSQPQISNRGRLVLGQEKEEQIKAAFTGTTINEQPYKVV